MVLDEKLKDHWSYHSSLWGEQNVQQFIQFLPIFETFLIKTAEVILMLEEKWETEISVQNFESVLDQRGKMTLLSHNSVATNWMDI